MPIKPDGAYITVGGYTLFVSDVKKSFLSEPFDRLEFSHERLRTASNSIRQKALLSTLLGNTPCQIVISGVSFDDIVPTYPDVTAASSDFQNIKKKFNIVRYEIQGAPSDYTAVENVLSLAQNHAQQIQKFQAHLQKAGAMDTEYDVLLTLQSETFSYITTTGVSMAGNSINGTETNMLITQFSPSVEYEEIIDALGNYRLLRSFSMVIENRAITALDQVV